MIDLEEIRKRNEARWRFIDTSNRGRTAMPKSAITPLEDIDTLLAEIERLRNELDNRPAFGEFG